MKLGYSITSAYPRDSTIEDVCEALIENAWTARDAGYEYIQVGDHHVMGDGQYLQNIPTAARLSAVFDHMAVMALLPLYNPILLAEQLGTLDEFLDELDVWFGLGWRPPEFEAFDVALDERVPRFEEGLEVIDRLWSADDISYDGRYWQFDDISVNPKAAPGRLCLAGSHESAVRRAGRLGDAWAAAPTETVEAMDTKIDDFREGGGHDVILRRDALVLADGDFAESLANELLATGYRDWGSDAPILTGDAETVAEELVKLSDLGVDEVVVRPMSEEYARETLLETARGVERL